MACNNILLHAMLSCLATYMYTAIADFGTAIPQQFVYSGYVQIAIL